MSKASNKKPATRAIVQNPAQNLASLILAAGSSGSIATAMRDILSRLPKNGKHNNSLTKAGLDFVKDELISQHAGAIRAMETILDEASLVANQKTELVHAHDTTELYGGGRPRTSGRVLEKLEEVKEEAAIFSYDVLQQTPQVLEMETDQYHYEATREDRPTFKNAMGKWTTADRVVDEVKTLEVLDDLGYHTMVFQPEEVNIVVEPEEVVVMDDAGKPAAIVTQSQGRVDTGQKCDRRIKYNIKNFKRTGMFGTPDISPDMVDDVTPKIDGEALYIKVGESKSFGFDRKGSRFKVTIDGMFEREQRKRRSVSILTEWVPRIEPGARVFVTHIWQFGTPNPCGTAYTKKLLSVKEVNVLWKEGKYRLNLGKPQLVQGTKVPLEFPYFGAPSDGLVVHQGRNQRFLKPYRTVDIKHAETYETLEKEYNVVFKDKQTAWVGHLCEFAVHSVKMVEGKNKPTNIEMVFVKHRLDKQGENDLDNIIELITSADFDTWFDELEERMEIGDLRQPDGWVDYSSFVRNRDPFTMTTYQN